MKPMSISVVIPLYNQLAYTKICLESLYPTINADIEVVVIDNGSSDGTCEYLAGCKGLTVIINTANRGCAAAWNQGVNATKSDWVVILNNDVILSPGWLQGLVLFAEENGLDIVSPGIREGDHNYDIDTYSKDYVSRMMNVSRMGVADGICFVVRRRVFEKIGMFDEMFRVGQFEDTDFFRRAKRAGFRLGTTGRSFIHHFGSITQNSIRQSKTVGPYEAENRAYYRQKWRLTWWRRILIRRAMKVQNFAWRTSERLFHRHSLKEKWMKGRLRFY